MSLSEISAVSLNQNPPQRHCRIPHFRCFSRMIEKMTSLFGADLFVPQAARSEVSLTALAF
jgi:hypothetical protein